MKFLKFSRKQTECGYEILKFLGARSFVLQRAAEFLNFMPAPSHNGFRILKFTSVPRNRFGILKFTRASARLADTAQNFILQRGFKILKFIQELPFAPRCVLPRVDSAETGRAARLTSQHTHDVIEKQSAVKFNHAGRYLNSARRYIARFRSAAARHGYEVGRTEKFSKFSLTNAFLNFISLPPRKFKLALLKFASEVPRNRSEILNFMFASYKLKLALRKFTPEPRKIKPTPAVRLNFALNSVPPARAVKFENGVKFKAAAKFKRDAR
ncbi:hypothetical protein [uncultured Campylobacter sp.]|mgnify:CR=1 FL=1|uniref:hypothetical protein n=1 Tax=uncultured Campylobacter sp. TaxID=218934 RepID=UPI00260E4373|nr:hypothetical protein [uncultured Campylobacter sp.]